MAMEVYTQNEKKINITKKSERTQIRFFFDSEVYCFLVGSASNQLQKISPLPPSPNKMSEINQKIETLKHGQAAG